MQNETKKNSHTTNPYEDIMHLSRPVSKTHPQMPIADRAAQFAPFAALTGYDVSIFEAARLTEKRIELDDKAIEILNIKLQFLKEHIKEQPKITVTYFVPDTKKDGGAYVEYSGTIRVMDETQKVIIMGDRTKIEIGMILDLQSEVFKGT